MGRPAGAALAAAFLVLGVGAVIAQSDPIATRQGLMKGNEENAIAVVRMMRGQAPFDAARVDAAFAQWADTAQKLPSLFPDSSKSGQKTLVHVSSIKAFIARHRVAVTSAAPPAQS